MQVTVENSGGLQRRLKVQVPGEEVQAKIDARLREIGKTAKLKGFRPGRVPMAVLKQRYGPSVRNEVVNQTLQRSLYQAIEQEALRPASNPVIEDIQDLKGAQDFEFTATIEVYPEVPHIDASGIAVTRPGTDVTESDVDDMLQTLREQRQSWVETDRAPAEGDQVVFDFSAETGDGRFPASGERRMALVLGTTPLDKLEKALTKLAPNEEAGVKQAFPDDFTEPALAGKKARVKLKLLQVQERRLPEVDEEFIRSFSVASGTMDDMRREVRNNLEREMQGARVTFLKMQILDALLAAHSDLEVPEAMVRGEAENLVRQQAQRREEEPDLSRADGFMEVARKRVKSALLLSEVARQNDILVDGARVRRAIESIADTYEQSREVVQMYYNNPELLAAVENSVLEEQVVDWVLDHAKVTDKPMQFKELIDSAARSRQGS